MHKDTLALHAGRDDALDNCWHAPPIDLSTTYPISNAQQATESLDAFVAGDAQSHNPVYARLNNPTVARFEQAFASLEGAEAAVAFASGMAAISALLLAAAQSGKRVLATRPIYGTTDHLLNAGLLGVTVQWVTPDTVAEHISDDVAMVMIETPTNPTCQLIDIQAVVDQAGTVPVAVDSTFATPILQQPLAHGARYAVHSATKFIGGHGDVIAGVIACSEADAKLLRQIRVATGGLLHPLAGYLLHRGLSTLPVRVKQAQANATSLAQRLTEHPLVERVYYPNSNETGANKQMQGPGCIIAFELAASPEQARKVLECVQLMTPAVSLGSVDTLIQHPASLTHRVVDDSGREEGHIRDNLLRLSVGLEHVDDLWADLQQAFDRVCTSSVRGVAA